MKRFLSIVLTLALLLTALPLALSVSAATTWNLVTNVSQLEAGSRVVIVAKDFNYALSTVQNDNNRAQVSITKGTDSTVTINSSVQILTLEAGNVSNSFAFNTGAGYLYAASSSKNYLRTETTLSDNSSWSITIAADGVATIKAQGSNTRNWMRYNSSSSLFACYGSGQADICLYVETETGGNEPECEHTGEKSYGKSDNEHWLICSDCNQEIADSRTEHDNTESEKNDATCTSTGSVTYTCNDCGNVVNATLPTIAHNYVDDGACSMCGAIAVFEFGENNETTGHKETTSAITTYNEEVNGYTFSLSLTADDKVYKDCFDEKGNGCLKLGTKSVAGVFSFTVPNNVKSVIIRVSGYKDAKAVISINNGEAKEINALSNDGEYEAITVDTTSTKTISFTTASGGYRAMVNSIAYIADETAECTHENTTTTNTATYFKDGMVTVVCDDCSETVSETEASASGVALDEENCKVEFENGNLTITLAYSEDLLKDIYKENGAVIYFNYSINGYTKTDLEIPQGNVAKVTLEGFNVDRLNAELTYYLTAKYDGVDTTKLAEDTTNSLKVSEKIDANSEIGVLMNALKTEANTVVSTKIDATTHFAENTITADLKEGTMVLNFIANDELVAKLTENKAYTRTNKITVTIDGVANKYEFTPDVMRKSTTINISGMSFEQLNGTVTVKVEFIYNNANVEDITDTITFEGAKAVEATDSAVATAFKKYIAK